MICIDINKNFQTLLLENVVYKYIELDFHGRR